jgi:N-acetylmuramoyl-L-alanine amidase
MRIVLDMQGQPDYQVIKENNEFVGIQISTPTYKNIVYRNGKKAQLFLKKNEGYSIDVSQIKHFDDYMNRMYKITLPEDYSKQYGQGQLSIGDGALNCIWIEQNANNQTELTFAEKHVYAYNVSENDEYLIISLIKPTEKYKQIIVLDPGHGGKDPGASGNGLKEKNLNLDTSLRLNQLLEANPNIKVYITRTQDTYPTLPDRSILANDIDADIFVSIHYNSFTSQHKGTEVLYFPGGSDVGNDLTSKKMAQIFQNLLVQNLGTKNRGIKSRPDLYVLRTTKMPAALIEIGFISNSEDAKKLKSDAFRQKAAEAIYEGIKMIFERYPTKR